METDSDSSLYCQDASFFLRIAFPAQFRPANPHDFEPYLQAIGPDELTAQFDNFSGDAKLIIPANTGDYGHIAAFCRTAMPQAWQALLAKSRGAVFGCDRTANVRLVQYPRPRRPLATCPASTVASKLFGVSAPRQH